MLRLHFAARLQTRTPGHTYRPLLRLPIPKATMSTFTLPNTCTRVKSTADLSQEELLSFPAFGVWIETLRKSLAAQKAPSHAFHGDPYVLRGIEIQAVDRFGGGRLGFVKMKAEVSNENGESLPGSVFLRGGSVAMLVSES